MNIQELKDKLKELAKLSETDAEMAHVNADDALIEFINDKEVTELFDNINMWYA